MDLGPDVNGCLTTLLWKVEKLLENQERVLKNQEKLLKLVGRQQGVSSPRRSVSGEQSLVNGVRTVDHEHSGPEKRNNKHTGELRLSASLLEAVAHVKSKTLCDTSDTAAPVPSNVDDKALKTASRAMAGNSSNATETNGSASQNNSVSVNESAAHQNTLFVSPAITALNAGCVNCDSSSGDAEHQDEHPSDSDETKELLSWAERVQKTSCSVGNFSVNLVKVLFTKDEILNRNCSGTRGKIALDSGKLDLVKFCAFKLYSIPQADQELVWKHKCVVSIDEFLRRGNRSRVQSKTKDAPLDLSVGDCQSDDVKVTRESIDETCEK